MRRVGAYLCDSSQQSNWDFVCQRTNTVNIPPDLTSDARLSLNLQSSHRIRMLPLGVVGYGESDLVHKYSMMTHTAKLQASANGQALLQSFSCVFKQFLIADAII